MRGTLHLATARDFAAMLARSCGRWASHPRPSIPQSPFRSGGWRGLDPLTELMTAGRTWLEETAADSRAAGGPAIAERWPDQWTRPSLAYALTPTCCRSVQVTPRGLWRREREPLSLHHRSGRGSGAR